MGIFDGFRPRGSASSPIGSYPDTITSPDWHKYGPTWESTYGRWGSVFGPIRQCGPQAPPYVTPAGHQMDETLARGQPSTSLGIAPIPQIGEEGPLPASCLLADLSHEFHYLCSRYTSGRDPAYRRIKEYKQDRADFMRAYRAFIYRHGRLGEEYLSYRRFKDTEDLQGEWLPREQWPQEKAPIPLCRMSRYGDQ